VEETGYIAGQTERNGSDIKLKTHESTRRQLYDSAAEGMVQVKGGIFMEGGTSQVSWVRVDGEKTGWQERDYNDRRGRKNWPSIRLREPINRKQTLLRGERRAPQIDFEEEICGNPVKKNSRGGHVKGLRTRHSTYFTNVAGSGKGAQLVAGTRKELWPWKGNLGRFLDRLPKGRLSEVSKRKKSGGKSRRQAQG